MKQVKVKRSSALNSDAVLKNNTKTTEKVVKQIKKDTNIIVSPYISEDGYVITKRGEHDYELIIEGSKYGTFEANELASEIIDYYNEYYGLCGIIRDDSVVSDVVNEIVSKKIMQTNKNIDAILKSKLAS